ncbi:sensor histidine kinase [Shewanella dokdonensis]|uniref:histidine kinase n=1 Tax=Shewanella dokdonensis TaxID=712036 RepID=A0ABX8DCK9_9GAMM|nr:ATP-binding protein [Shewanella dokdonensis]MCL1074592.1 ATP-binding protein [Shewanella dokdonensis]QVK22396.1 two-component sensor histidine kinase [Shewanella dokdonensis]
MNNHSLASLLDKLPLGICIVDRKYRILYINLRFIKELQLPAEIRLGASLLQLCQAQAPLLQQHLDNVAGRTGDTFPSDIHPPETFEFIPETDTTVPGVYAILHMEIVPLSINDGEVKTLCLLLDAGSSYTQAKQKMAQELAAEHEQQQQLLDKLETARGQLVQAEKMASIGQLAAGIAHEINNPIGFISSNLQSLQDYVGRLLSIIHDSESLLNEQQRQQLQQLMEQQQFGFIREDIKELLEESLDGVNRVATIVNSLKSFSHVDNSDWQYADLIDGMENTLKIIHNQLKYRIQLHKDYQEGLPLLYCQPMQLNQVFMNLLMNAAQAIEGDGDIWISIHTMPQDQGMEIRIKDNGCGIEPQNLHKIFEPFYTTKPVGSGTGLGLSLSYSIIQKQHGKISVNSKVGEGTEFVVRLPLQGERRLRQ